MTLAAPPCASSLSQIVSKRKKKMLAVAKKGAKSYVSKLGKSAPKFSPRDDSEGQV